ncbi:type I polyketide synthase [Mongoliitalea daihaiensis]|uniref:type I polyketide synthase n=1 Tax=Mongoliitalea daihaiensis TaxID=2782006 RepID=UPI001F1A472E|nr:type I polyketide synthase [Mongoliitalea daihaiensis]UJP66881.1 aminotransferase class III-fold pyridoxal phosphate-dependent enzyme [Mongoliitalea daihaiensis]
MSFLHIYFQKSVSSFPERKALVLGEQYLTFHSLDEKSKFFASQIHSKYGEGNIIGLSGTKNLNMIVALLAIFRSGNAYLPLDPTFPKSRLQDMITTAQLSTVICQNDEINLWTDLELTAFPVPKEMTTVEFEDKFFPLAAVLFTSGSTGKPKGVKLLHKGLHGHIENKLNIGKQIFELCSEKIFKFTQFAHIGFDASIKEIFECFAVGGELHLLGDEVRKDSWEFLKYLKSQSINSIDIPIATLTLLVEEVLKQKETLPSLKQVTVGGEVLKITTQIREFFTNHTKAILVNDYGPTEASIAVTHKVLNGAPQDWDELPSIGEALDNATLFVLNERLEEVGEGEIGELFIGGPCLAEGYIHNQSLTDDRFIFWDRGREIIRLYSTGDQVCKLGNEFYFKGRADDQIKIHGNRVELAEIELAISSIPGVGESAVKLHTEESGLKSIIGYFTITDISIVNKVDVLKGIASKLPSYMIPAQLIELNEIPKTSTGKIDKRALPITTKERPDWLGELLIPTNKTEEKILAIFKYFLRYEVLGINDNFFELGGNSFLAQRTISELRFLYQLTIPIIEFYKSPTTKALAAFLDGKNQSLELSNANKLDSQRPEVAIIGMEFNFPGTSNEESLLKVLTEGKETIQFFTKDELDASLSSALLNNPNLVAARGIVDGYREFDSGFFGLNVKVAELADPQIRKLLELSYAVLEKTGYASTDEGGLEIGVFAGASKNTYYEHNLLSHKDLLSMYGDFQVDSLNEKDYIASRIAYHLNLTGPAASVYSACSTSLLAVAQAVEAIQSGKCSMALAGAASIHSPVETGHVYEEGGVYSRDGHVYSFDSRANGTVFSDGLGVVLLKRLDQALKDGDPVLAVVKGVGINNDGGAKGSFSGPSALGQAKAIRMAFEKSGLQPKDVSYLEAHATATPLGDPIEIDGLTMVFGKEKSKHGCAIGTIKANIGHLNAASGMAGMVKVLLSIKYKQLFPQINYKQTNPNINFEDSPFYVNTELKTWETTANQPRVAGISSLGVGGTNVHLILGEYQSKQDTQLPNKISRPAYLLGWSAKSQESADAYKEKLESYLQKTPVLDLQDVAYTLHQKRPSFQWKNFAVASKTDGYFIFESAVPSVTSLKHQKNVFLFPGQGAQFVNMGLQLFKSNEFFKASVDACDAIIQRVAGFSICESIFKEIVDEQAILNLNNTKFTQPALFSIEYALAKLMQELGIQPDLLCGHSVGEFVAAHLAGVFSLEDALKLVCERGRLISELPGGIMMSIRATLEDVSPFLTEGVSVAGVNAAKQIVVAGEQETIEALEKVLSRNGIVNRILRTSHAFHSHMMDAAKEPFRELFSQIQLSPPKKPIISTVTGQLLTAEEACDVNYWVGHMREAVMFYDAASTILQQEEYAVFIELGPGKVLSSLLRQHSQSKGKLIVNTLDEENSYAAFLTSLGKLWSIGLPLKLDTINGESGKLVDLPTYAFRKQKLWIEPALQARTEEMKQEFSQPIQEQFIQPINKPMERLTTLKNKVFEMLADAAGIESQSEDESFFEMGIDSLLLTQMVSMVKSKFNVPVTFKQLNSELSDVKSLATYLDQVLPKEAIPVAAVQPVSQIPSQAIPLGVSSAVPQMQQVQSIQPIQSGATGNLHLQLISRQLELLSQQIQVLSGGITENSLVPSQPITQDVSQAPEANSLVASEKPAPQAPVEVKKQKTFGAMARIEKQRAKLSASQEVFIHNFQKRFNEKTKGSKAYTQEHRPYMADPRVVSGFKPAIKEITYSLVVNKSKGKYLWDVDGNQYLDALNGFGSVFLGHNPDFIKNAIIDQLEKGYEIGPQHELSGVVSKMIQEVLGHDRVALCNTGSEAVLGAVRMARTVTGRSLVISFNGSYHGIFDEVIVRSLPNGKSYPAAAGIMPESVHNIMVLEYGTPESLEIIRQRKDDIAAVLVEPVQSRSPEFVPIEFLKEVRTICNESGSALIFDEVITGFRMGMQGVQGLMGIKADIASYGKVVGGGISIGVMAGSSRFMDALDGGFWQYGDDSVPEAGVTYFAGTFVRHPLALASTKASVEYLIKDNGAIQRRLNDYTTHLMKRLNQVFEHYNLPMYTVNFGSLWLTKYKEELPQSELIFALMREKGIHIYENFPCFLTEPYETSDLDRIVQSFQDSIQELVAHGFFADYVGELKEKRSNPFEQAPIPGAELGLDSHGKPAWFKKDTTQSGTFYKIDVN